MPRKRPKRKGAQSARRVHFARNPPGLSSRPRQGLTIRRERTPEGYLLRFTGPEASGMMIDSVLDDIERMYAPV
ncbi:MAG: hypothetical protein Q8J98_09065 [Phaeovulum sp.]|uniref:hypothetical protein n=1 Tax=Phaeovulum sp. TaxID=2934796 RepID=UPI00272FC4BC|nr:hypothetical protein [Phaeovulum sp.]MDP2063238.1 hypothetical protein [Phaeovulum sp.]